MALNEQYITRAEQYIRNDMSSHEKASFEAEMKSNEALKSAYDFVKDTEKALDAVEYERLKSLLGQNKKNSGLSAKRWLAIAASIVMVATLGYLIFSESQNSTDELYQTYYEAYPNIIDPVNRSSAGSSSPFQLYEQGNLNEALDYLSVMSASDTTLFYKGQVHMSLGNYEKAVTAIKRLDENSTFYASGQWYLALAYLKLGEKKKAESLLQAIVDSGSSYAERAAKIKAAL